MRKFSRHVMVAGFFWGLGLVQSASAGVAGLSPLFAQEESKRNYTFQSLMVLVLAAAAVVVICKPSRRQL